MSEKLVSEEKLRSALAEVLKITDRNMEKIGEKFPERSSVNQKYPIEGNVAWTSGFWTGILWLAYEMTGDSKYRMLAEKNVDSFYERIEKKIEVNHHDMGFLYTPSCVAAYKLTNNQKAKTAAIMAADHLFNRYIPKGEFLNAWANIDAIDSNKRNFYIIDCLLNIPLLYWASEETGDGKYREIAWKHLNTTMNTIFREDGSTYHKYIFDINTGEPLYGATAQGFADDSCWSRGQAWGIYGFALNYAYTRDEKDWVCFKRATDYFIKYLPKDYVCYWDLCFTEGEEPRDSSAAIIAVCGIMEMYKYFPDDKDMQRYYDIASKILNSLIDNYAVKSNSDADGFLLHSTASKPHNMGIDECSIFGDYYYLEAIVRSLTSWKMYW